MPTSRQIATGYHEASHAVAALSLGLRLRKKGVSIERDEDSLGRCYIRNPFRGDPDYTSATQRLNAEKRVIVLLSGHEGQKPSVRAPVMADGRTAKTRQVCCVTLSGRSGKWTHI